MRLANSTMLVRPYAPAAAASRMAAARCTPASVQRRSAAQATATARRAPARPQQQQPLPPSAAGACMPAFAKPPLAAEAAAGPRGVRCFASRNAAWLSANNPLGYFGFPDDELESQEEQKQTNYIIGEVVAGVVDSVRPFGAFVNLGGGVTGLLHVNQISQERVAAIEGVLAEGDQVIAVILSRKQGRMSLSTRVLEPEPGDMLRDRQKVFDAAEETAAAWRERLQGCRVGSVMAGTVRSVQPYGAFVDLGSGVRCLLHVSEVSKEPLAAMDGLLAEGDQVKAIVIKRSGERIDLSTKELEPKPGDMLRDRQKVFDAAERTAAARRERQVLGYRVGDVVTGTVQSVRAYGAFVDLGGGVVGLLHISQISHMRITTDEVFDKGDQVKAMVLTRDAERGRIALSTRALELKPGDMQYDRQKVFDAAEQTAAAWRERQEAKAAAEAAKAASKA